MSTGKERHIAFVKNMRNSIREYEEKKVLFICEGIYYDAGRGLQLGGSERPPDEVR